MMIDCPQNITFRVEFNRSEIINEKKSAYYRYSRDVKYFVNENEVSLEEFTREINKYINLGLIKHENSH
jgi:protein tyrosine phosphatase